MKEDIKIEISVIGYDCITEINAAMHKIDI